MITFCFSEIFTVCLDLFSFSYILFYFCFRWNFNKIGAYFTCKCKVPIIYQRREYGQDDGVFGWWSFKKFLLELECKFIVLAKHIWKYIGHYQRKNSMGPDFYLDCVVSWWAFAKCRIWSYSNNTIQ